MLYEEKRLLAGSDSGLALSVNKEHLDGAYDNPSLSSDRMLWDNFKKGDELAFTRIYNDYALALYQCGCKISPDPELVKDCLQDFFIYLKKNRLGFSDTNSIKPYLVKAFRRRVIEYLKKERRHVSVIEPSEFIQFGVEPSCEVIYISKQLKVNQLEKLNKALDSLDRTEQKAIYYFYYKGLSYEQIAEIFKFSHVSSARRVMYRSLKQLRHFFSFS
jgi:RNA polymerase sigma factor (sigma-70 family)